MRDAGGRLPYPHRAPDAVMTLGFGDASIRIPRMREHDLIYDWNEAGERWEPPAHRIQLDDETLRDGLQSPSVRNPSIEEKLAILHLLDRLGIDTADIAL